MTEKTVKIAFKRQPLISFLTALDKIKKTPTEGLKYKTQLTLHYSQMDEEVKEEIKKITGDITKAITDSKLRRALIEYSERKLKSKN